MPAAAVTAAGTGHREKQNPAEDAIPDQSSTALVIQNPRQQLTRAAAGLGLWAPAQSDTSF